ncbi:MAG TPA: alpha/beta hydrolase [Jatrophihabitantaceae bacterium]|nr:alpha/beta hydrolase [Jatrophihabitantaceae bacterium]
MTRFVLIPGAGGVAWYWSRVAALLQEAGAEAIPVDLPGDDPAAGLAAYVELIAATVDGRRDTVLVAQSLGGFCAPLVARRVPVRAIVFVNAMIPEPGELVGDWWAATGSESARTAAAAERGYPAEFDLHTYFLHDVDPAVAAEGEPYQRPETDAVFDSACDFESWPDVAVRVVAGADDRFFPLEFQRRVSRERLGIEPDVVPGGHLAALSQPRALADYLLAV